MAHDYDNIDIDIVWDIVQKALPILKLQVRKVLEQESDKS